MRSIAILAGVFLIAAITAVSVPKTSVAAAASSRQSQCEAQKKACLAAGAQTGQFGTRYVPPDVVKQCYDGYRMCV